MALPEELLLSPAVATAVEDATPPVHVTSVPIIILLWLCMGFYWSCYTLFKTQVASSYALLGYSAMDSPSMITTSG